MRKVGLQHLQGNERLGRAIFDEEGRVLLREGVVLKQGFIEKLLSLGIGSVYIEDALSQGIDVQDVVAEETRQESKKAIAETMRRFVRHGELSLRGVVASAQKVIDEILLQKEVMFNLVDVRAKEDNLFSHSVNVCILAVMTGVNMGYNLALLKELAAGALLHDVGMLAIMKEMVPGSGRQEVDWTRYREHPKRGYDLLNQQSISSYVKVIALTHHEKCDASGFPLGLKGEEINEMVKIISVCDAFDRIVHGKRERYDVPPFQAIEFLEASRQLFEPLVVDKFVRNVSLYPSGYRVRLNDGRQCVVVRQNQGFASRPVVRQLEDAGQKEIDLSSELTLFIEEAYED